MNFLANPMLSEGGFTSSSIGHRRAKAHRVRVCGETWRPWNLSMAENQH